MDLCHLDKVLINSVGGCVGWYTIGIEFCSLEKIPRNQQLKSISILWPDAALKGTNVLLFTPGINCSHVWVVVTILLVIED